MIKFKLNDRLKSNSSKILFDSEIQIHQAEIFKYLRKLENLDLKISIHPIKNQLVVENQSDLDGGKSGEFFYQTWDEKIIIKTVSSDDLNSLLKILPKYQQYLFQNPQSLIAKIYGLYTFKRINTEFHVIVMSNIGLGIPNSYIKRKFDMKGSTYDRQVIKDNNYDIDLTRQTLKDIDFIKMECQVWINQKNSQRIFKQLINDSNFLKSQNLMDYSLLVMKIDWGQYIKDKNLTIKQVQVQVKNPLLCTESKNEPGIYYHIAIIDYLQEWNTKKATEKMLKKIKTMDANLNTSSQDSETYANRFENNLLKQIFDFQSNENDTDKSIISQPKQSVQSSYIKQSVSSSQIQMVLQRSYIE